MGANAMVSPQPVFRKRYQGEIPKYCSLMTGFNFMEKIKIESDIGCAKLCEAVIGQFVTKINSSNDKRWLSESQRWCIEDEVWIEGYGDSFNRHPDKVRTSLLALIEKRLEKL